MKVLKFRAWIPEAKWKEESMFYQEDQYLSSFLNRIYSSYECNHPSHLDFEVEERLMQYTGLKDKNGIEIYEGDIVNTDYIKNAKVIYDTNSDGTSNIGFVFVKIGAEEDGFFFFQTGIEVIGNIYENKELLNGN